MYSKKGVKKTYTSGYSLVVTDLTTNLPLRTLLLLGQRHPKSEVGASRTGIPNLRFWRFKSQAFFPTLPLCHLTGNETDHFTHPKKLLVHFKQPLP